MTDTRDTAPLVLGTEKIGKLLMQYAIPAIIAMTASSLYNMVDSIFIGHGVGPLAIAGLAITFPFMLGLIAIPYIGWTLGTVLGAFINNLQPTSLADAMGITLYAMFIAIIIPASRRDKNVLFVLIAAVILSCVLYFALPFISSGWAVIITAVLASAFGATFFPHNEEGEK